MGWWAFPPLIVWPLTAIGMWLDRRYGWTVASVRQDGPRRIDGDHHGW